MLLVMHVEIPTIYLEFTSQNTGSYTRQNS